MRIPALFPFSLGAGALVGLAIAAGCATMEPPHRFIKQATSLPSTAAIAEPAFYVCIDFSRGSAPFNNDDPITTIDSDKRTRVYICGSSNKLSVAEGMAQTQASYDAHMAQQYPDKGEFHTYVMHVGEEVIAHPLSTTAPIIPTPEPTDNYEIKHMSVDQRPLQLR